MPTLHLQTLHHLAIKARDLRAMLSFYRDFLGLPLIDTQFDANGNVRAYWLSTPPTILMIERGESPPKDREGGLHLLAFSIEMSDRALWKAKFAEAGVLIESESPYSLYFRDPEGNRLALSHYPKLLNH